jgi:type II restriction enzyme
MQLRMPADLAGKYKSPAQRARVVSEAWGERNLYCANCASPSLTRSAAGTAAVDYSCPECASPFQLKSQSRPLSGRIVDAAYYAMRRAIERASTPNLVALHYDPSQWVVRDAVLIPRFVFSLSCLEKRPPLPVTARRHGWVGCYILLGNIPPDAKIALVTNGVATNPTDVRRQFARLRPLENVRHDARGWTLDVLNVVRRLQEPRRGTPWRAPTEFTLGEVYAFADELARLHPRNKNIEPKIRQQLQELRELGILEFLGRGRYRLW